jgi:hypothetical protein
MMSDVFEKPIHCLQRADLAPAWRRRPPQKAAEYSSRSVRNTPREVRPAS